MTLEILHLALVLLGRRPAFERAEIAALARLGIHLARIEAVFARRQFADHDRTSCWPRSQRPVPELVPASNHQAGAPDKEANE